MTYGTVNADLMTTSDGISSAGLYGFKNRIINGAMVIDQRNAGASVTPANGAYTLDRWQVVATQASKFTVQQGSGSAPVGFINYLLVVSSSAYSVGSSDTFDIQQPIEGLNVSDLSWGSANAKAVTLSFQVISSLTGTFGGAITNSAANRSYPFSYTISSANTWTSISVTIPGDTSGTWLTTNGIGLIVRFGLGSGSTFSGTSGAWAAGNLIQPTGTVSVVGTSSANWAVTGVQLEKGSTATSFDYLDYGRSLMQCQRYLPAFTTDTANPSVVGSGGFSTSTRIAVQYTFPVTPRTSPTGITVSSAAHFNVSDNATGTACTAVTFNAGGLSCAQVYFDTATTYAAFRSGITYSSNASAKILFNGCEL